MRAPAHVLVLSTADWDAPLWTNKQYVALELARDFRVTYVESLGLRRVAARWPDLLRVGRRIRRAVVGGGELGGHRPRPESLAIVSPLVLPLHDSRAARLLNPTLIRRSLRAWLSSPKRLLWTFSPVTYGLDELAHGTVYHAVDLLHESPGHYRHAVLAGERNLAARGHRAVASSGVVMEHLRAVGFSRIELWENVADVRLFAQSASPERLPSGVLFAGNLSVHKVDFDLLSRIAALPGCSLHIAGPASIDGSPAPDLERLRAAGATLHGPLAPRELARLAGSCVVGIIPYVINGYTAGVFPMKLYEYLAAGNLVVTTALPSILLHASEDVVIANSTDAFITAVSANLSAPDQTAIDRRQALAYSHSWEARGEDARTLVRDLLATKGP